jgi:hypothetical protein
MELFVGSRPNFKLTEGTVVEHRVEHGEMLGAPDTEIFVIRALDGRLIERSCSMSVGSRFMFFSGFVEDEIKIV